MPHRRENQAASSAAPSTPSSAPSTRFAEPPHAPGRQAAKSAETRGRLCDAAAHCYATIGYHQTSLKAVLAACGASQGALQHHFPTKRDLTAATARRLLEKSVRWFQRTDFGKNTGFGKTKGTTNGDAAFASVIFGSWREQFRSDDYAALLEIMVAARTDASLRLAIREPLQEWDAAIRAELALRLPATEDQDRLELALTISRTVMTGLLVHDALLDDEERIDSVLRGWVGIAGPSGRDSGL